MIDFHERQKDENMSDSSLEGLLRAQSLLAKCGANMETAHLELRELIAQDSTIQAQLACDAIETAFEHFNAARAALAGPLSEPASEPHVDWPAVRASFERQYGVPSVPRDGEGRSAEQSPEASSPQINIAPAGHVQQETPSPNIIKQAELQLRARIAPSDSIGQRAILNLVAAARRSLSRGEEPK